MKLKTVRIMFTILALIFISNMVLLVQRDIAWQKAEIKIERLEKEVEVTEDLYEEFLDWLHQKNISFDKENQNQLDELWLLFLIDKYSPKPSENI